MRLYFQKLSENKQENNFNIHILTGLYLNFSSLFKVSVKCTKEKTGYFQTVSQIIICMYLPERQIYNTYMLSKYSILNGTNHIYNQKFNQKYRYTEEKQFLGNIYILLFAVYVQILATQIANEFHMNMLLPISSTEFYYISTILQMLW